MWELGGNFGKNCGGDGIGKRGELMLKNEAKNIAWLSVFVCHKSDSDRGVWHLHCRNVVVAKYGEDAVCVH